MQYIDDILGILGDSQWHSFDDIKKEIALPDEKLNKIFSFLHEQEFIIKEKERLRIKGRGLKFLELPL